MTNYEIINNTDKHIEHLDDIKKAIDYAIKSEFVSDVIFNIIIVDNETIRDLNKKYRNIDDYTDVISFALEDNKDMIELPYRVLGDIYISIDKAIMQANEYKHTLKRELTFLSVHGFLHLLGYDHVNSILEKEMFLKQEKILDEYEKI